ncbi:iron-containing alcohol dehydrogenase family protein [Clostridium pasteurianum]|uniref:Alcohol dehydrogenase, class IV n=1 Tax=Clostridium pasteurianum BC1 TaxID=86416 RepID=R4K8J6_CLOPA|nr:iron-containing alcohol dehydrogenase family protein [Clostridium pasteurianum]AGK95965.1 alcohol dehydrogenase, class IV [Clostridium pasteurianum BC1]
MDWFYKQPVKIIFGIDKVKDLYNILKDLNYKNGLLVCGPSFAENGAAEKILDYSKGLITKIFSNIVPNPTVDNVDNCADVIRKNNIGFVLALGGGSPIDCAKAAASLCKTEDSIVLYHNQEKKFGKEHIPLIAVPTTSGTGSEVTAVSVLTNPHIGRKAPLASENFYPEYAIVDPTLTLTVPKQITASTGLDVLSHALEGFWSKDHQPICDALALHAASLVFKYLEKAYINGEDIEAREKMSEASLIAGLAFGLPKTTGSHACSFPLTNIYKLPHGEACAFTLDYFTRINAEAEDGRVNDFAKQLGFKDANDMADRIKELKFSMNMKVSLQDAGIRDEEVETLAELSIHPNLLNNPVKMEKKDLIEMFRSFK